VDEEALKDAFRVHHFPVDLTHDPEMTVEATRYWYGLFSHTRSAVWKGMLRIEVDTAEMDEQARELLKEQT
jgi:hypothetical protein